MEIKKTGCEDIALIQEIGATVYWSTYPAILGEEQVQYMLRKFYNPEALADQMLRGHSFWMVFIDGAPAAFTSFSETDKGAGTWHLQKIYILAEMQGKGIGRRLLKEVAEHCRKNGGQRLQLNVNRYNRAKEFYEKLGFRVIREEDVAIGEGYYMNDFVMELDLKEMADNNR